MKAVPAVPPLEEAPAALLEDGHLWLLEAVEGDLLRFQVQPSGMLRFGSRERVVDDPDALPHRFRHAVLYLRDHLDRDGLREAVADPSALTFIGIATQYDGLPYRWARLPSFLGVDIWSAERGCWYPPDTTHAIFEALGVAPLNPIEREVRPRDFNPETLTHPDSAWYDGPIAGLLIQNKHGDRALLENPEIDGEDSDLADTLDEIVADTTKQERIAAVIETLESTDQPVTPDRLTERLLAEAWRTHHPVLGQTHAGIDEGRLRAAITARVEAVLTAEDRTSS